MNRSILILALLALASCSGPDSKEGERVNGYQQPMKTAEDSVMHEVMEAHDEAMAKTGRLNYLKIKLDSLIKAGSSSDKQVYKALRNKLDTADDHMQRWMGEFNLDSAQDDGPGRMPYLVKEKGKIDAARDLMLNNLAEVDSVLNR